MIYTADIKKGVYIELDGTPFEVVDFQHVKPGKGNAFVKTRLKNLLLNTVWDRTFKSGEKFEEPDIDKKWMQYLYRDGSGYHFLDMDSYEQYQVDNEIIGDNTLYLTENLEMDILIYKGKAISIALPNFVSLEVEYTEPALKGDTVSGGGKPAKLTTGLNVTVPFHIKQGDVLKIDTRSGQYVEKVK